MKFSSYQAIAIIQRKLLKTCNPHYKNVSHYRSWTNIKYYWNILIFIFSESICYAPSKESTHVMCNPTTAEFWTHRPIIPVAWAERKNHFRWASVSVVIIKNMYEMYSEQKEYLYLIYVHVLAHFFFLQFLFGVRI